TPLTAMRTNLEVLSTLDLPEEQRKEVVNDVIRTQSRIEATLGALERLAQGELSTSEDHVPVDITELLDRAAHDAMRSYPDLEVSLVPSPTCIIVGLPAGLRLAVDNAIANAVKHGGATRVQLSAVSPRAGVDIAIDDNGCGVPRDERPPSAAAAGEAAVRPLTQAVDVIIVGGGHSGLPAAAYLARAGLRVRLLERLQHIGGAAISAPAFDGVDARVSRYAYLVSLL